MKMFLDTSSTQTVLRLDDKVYVENFGNDLAEKIHAFIFEKLKANNADWLDLTEITFMAGPGSFTGLRIGATIVNTLADQLKIPLYKTTGEQVPIIIPEYGRPANVTLPKK